MYCTKDNNGTAKFKTHKNIKYQPTINVFFIVLFTSRFLFFIRDLHISLYPSLYLDKYCRLFFHILINEDAFLTVYATVWTITIGIIVFIIQHGYGKTLGLHFKDIILLILSLKQLFLIIIHFIINFFIFLHCYINGFRLMLLWLTVEAFIKLITLILFLTKLTSIKTIEELLKEDVKLYINQIFSGTTINECILVKCSENLNFDDVGEVNAFTNILCSFFKAIDDVLPNTSSSSKFLAFSEKLCYISKQTTSSVFKNMQSSGCDSDKRDEIIVDCFKQLYSHDKTDNKKTCNLTLLFILENLINVYKTDLSPESTKKYVQCIDASTTYTLTNDLLFYFSFISSEVNRTKYFILYIRSLLSENVSTHDDKKFKKRYPYFLLYLYIKYLEKPPSLSSGSKTQESSNFNTYTDLAVVLEIKLNRLQQFSLEEFGYEFRK